MESRFITSAFTAVILYEARRLWDVEFFFHLMFLLWFLIFKPGIVQQGFLLGLGDIFFFLIRGEEGCLFFFYLALF